VEVVVTVGEGPWCSIRKMERAVLHRRDLRTRSGRRSAELRHAIGAELRQLRLDAHLSLRAVAAAASVTASHLSEIERGNAEASLATLAALADVLGSDLSIRLYPRTGPRIHDRHQAAMIEVLLKQAHPTWRRTVEVPVWRPVRGVIDLVIARPGQIAVAVEAHSEICRLEQHLRWAAEKAAALPSSKEWTRLAAGAPSLPVSRLLVLRNTKANRDLVRAFAETLAAAYPARTGDVAAALRDPRRPWPGDAVLWADVAGGTAPILDRAPRGVSLGR